MKRCSTSARSSVGSPYSSVASTSTPAADAVRPISQPASPRARSSLAAYGAPDAPVTPRKTCICAALLFALGGVEEGGELGQLLLVHAAAELLAVPGHDRVPELGRVRHVALEILDAPTGRADLGEIGRAEVRRADA